MERGPWESFVHTSQWTLSLAGTLFVAFLCIAAFACLVSMVIQRDWRFWKH